MNFIVCTVLHVKGMVDFTDTIKLSSLVAVGTIILILITVAADFKKKKITDYSIVIGGIVGAFISACIEIILYFRKSIFFSGVVL